MKPAKKMLLMLALALLFAPIVRAEGIKFDHLSLDEAFAKAKKENKIVFIDVYATWCGPCKYLSNSVFPDKDLGELMNENFVCIKVDGEASDGDRLASQFGIEGYPTMMFISTDNVLHKKIVGAVEADRIINTAQAVLDPESTKIHQLQTDYEAGNRNQEFMLEFITETLSEGQDAITLANEYLELFPELSLEDEDDFLIFYLTSDALDDKYVKEFMANPQKYSDLHFDLAQRKADAMIGKIIEDAVRDADRDSIKQGVGVIFDTYVIVNGADAYAEEELVGLLENYYDEQF